MLRVMDLFSGIGGFSLGLKRTGGFRTVAYCEIEPYCQAVLLARMRDGWLDTAPICSDIRRLDGDGWRLGVDVVTGGFPCQDISVAGNQAGITGERSGLWGEMERVIRGVRPHIVIVENVSALLGYGLGRVLGDLAALGYDSEWDCIPAAAFSAPHRRDRVWIIASDTKRTRLSTGLLASGRAFDPRAEGPAGFWAQWWVHESSGLDGRWMDAAPEARSAAAAWEHAPCEPMLLGVPDGVSGRVDRLRALGNAIVPQIAEWIGNRILESSPPHRGRRKGK